MPHISDRQRLLDALSTARQHLELQIYLEILQEAISDAESSSGSSGSSESDPSESSSDTSDSESSPIVTAASSSPDLPTLALLTNYHGLVAALENEVKLARVLQSHPPSSRISQLPLLDEWRFDHLELFVRKLRVPPRIFEDIVDLIKNHPIFHNNSNNSQLPVSIQLAIFLNAAGHYGNAATSQDMAEWAGVSVGTVHNCYKRVMVAILHHDDDFIHFDLNHPKDLRDKQRAQRYVEEKTCAQWKGGFLCVDGTPFKLFQKPGWHGEGFFDRKSNYSLSNQVSGIYYFIR